MTPTREFWKWTWPSWDRVFFLDFMVTIGVIGVLAAIGLTSYSGLVFKAKLSEAILATGRIDGRAEIVERLALSGDPVEAPLDGGTAVVAATAGAFLSGQRTVETKAEQRKAEPRSASAETSDTKNALSGAAASARVSAAETGGGGVGRYARATRVVGNAIIVTGMIDERPYELALFPAIADEELPAVYIWLCGRARVPEGWLAQPPALAQELPNHLQLPECRRRRKS